MPPRSRTVERDPLLGIYLEDISQFPLLTMEGELRLGQRSRAGDRAARQELIQCNLRLVVSIARQYEHLGLPLLDVIEEGNIGLMRAAERFDPSLGYRFVSYAVHWIRQGIRYALAEKGRCVRMPVYMAELVSRWRHHGGPPEDPRSQEDLAELMRALRLPECNLSLIRRVLAAARQGSVSLDQSMGVEGIMFEALEIDPSRGILDQESVELLRQRLEFLPEREIEVLRYRFGLDGYPALTLEEAGEVFGLTRERVRQIEIQALGRLRGMITADAV